MHSYTYVCMCDFNAKYSSHSGSKKFESHCVRSFHFRGEKTETKLLRPQTGGAETGHLRVEVAHGSMACSLFTDEEIKTQGEDVASPGHTERDGIACDFSL